ncbi:MAG: NYN domain-containing protein [Candidatus Babeliales bacterium]
MIIVVDGYNVLKLVHKSKNIGESVRSQFLKQLAAYGKQRGHTLVLVFDGGPYDMSTFERLGQATVVYVGYRETADDYIKRYLTEHRNREIVLVTHDRDLVSFASQLDIPTIGVWLFYEKVLKKEVQYGVQPPPVKGQAHKLHPEEVDAELDAMLEQADILEKVEYEPSSDRAQYGKKQSKEKKSLETLLKKL